MSIIEYHQKLLAEARVENPGRNALRSLEMERLRDEVYPNLINRAFGWKFPPKGSFNRFLIEAHIDHLSTDPLIPSTENGEWVSKSLMREITEDFPIKVNPPIQYVTDLQGLQKHARIYLSGVNSMIQKTKSNELKRTRQQFGIVENFEELMDSYLKFRSRVHQIAVKLWGKKARDICLKLLRSCNAAVIKLENMYPPWSQIRVDDNTYSIRIGLSQGYQVKAPQHQIDKLLTLFGQNQTDANFNDCLFNCLARYNAYLGFDRSSGGLQGAIPRRVFEVLSSELGVHMELFASPWNSYFPKYCSAFPDTDVYFGSVGSFFDPKLDPYLVEGSYEANPPFTEECILKMVERMDYLLSNSELPLSFTIIIPSWEDSEGYLALQDSPYLRAQYRLLPKEHYYISGTQIRDEQPNLYKAIHSTNIFILQNDIGNQKWFPSTEKLEQIRIAFQSP